MTCDNITSSTATERGKWWHPSSWRLHFSTCIIAGVIVIALLLANVPGQLVLVADPDVYVPGILLPAYMNPYIDHGWPWTFIRRGIADSEFSSDSTVFGTEGDCWDYVKAVNPSSLWTLSRNIEKTSWYCLAGDILTAAIVLAVGIGLFEARRRRTRLFQVRVVELTGLSLLLSIGLISLASQIRQRDEEQVAMKQLTYESYQEERAGPHWLRQLVGPRFF